MTPDVFVQQFTADEWDALWQFIGNANYYTFTKVWNWCLAMTWVANADYQAMLDALYNSTIITQARYDAIMLNIPAVGATRIVPRATLS